MKKKCSILIAEDDEDDQLLLQSAFDEKVKNCQLTFVSDGLLLLNKLKEYTTLPDLIMLDLNMPKINGWEILNEITKDEKLNHIPRMIFSTSSADNEIKRAYSLGASAYIVKPASYKDLLKYVENITNFYLKTAILA
jgi:CheY-like chemotaxis protein